MNSTPGTPRTPVRIYVMWHPDFEPGQKIADEIYRWFRLDNMEGIPVFFRSTKAKGDARPLPIPADSDVAYLIPLIEANMAADPEWRSYLLGLRRNRTDCRLLPVAMDSLAYQVPPEIRSLNFIRHDLTASPSPDTEVLLSALTEVMARDLRYRLHQLAQRAGVEGKPDPAAPATVRPPDKIRIFLSHAKADRTDVPRRLQQYIQTRTQCETFFDENDIPSGHDFAGVLDRAIKDDSAGMLVIHGDAYAERPWCRREIRSFQNPVRERLPDGSTGQGGQAFFLPPLVVVENLTGCSVSRSIPELGYSAAIRWTEKGERRIVNTLLREIVLGLFYRLLVHNSLRQSRAGDILVNRAPDPVLTQRLLNAYRDSFPGGPKDDGPVRTGKAAEAFRILYPGYGLSLLELDSLRRDFGGAGVRFETLSSIARSERTDDAPTDGLVPELGGRTVRLGIGNATDSLDGGVGDRHNQELVLRLFRPLARAGVSILYGGTMPAAAGPLGWEGTINFTETCLHLLLSERAGDTDGTGMTRRSEVSAACLYNLSVWPGSKAIDPPMIARWSDVCRFRCILPAELPAARRQPRTGEISLGPAVDLPGAFVPHPAGYDRPSQRRRAEEAHACRCREVTEQHAVVEATGLSHLRRLACGPITFPRLERPEGGVPHDTIRPLAHVFLGGRLNRVNGVAPGLFEEILYALQAGVPVLLLGAGYGAAGAVARWFLQAVESPRKPLVRPPEFTPSACLASDRDRATFSTLQAWRARGRLARNQLLLPEVLSGLHRQVARVRRSGLAEIFQNRLSEEENQRLLAPQTGYGDLCCLVWKSLNALASDSTRE